MEEKKSEKSWKTICAKILNTPLECAVWRFYGSPIIIHASVILCFLYFWAHDGWAEGNIAAICFLFLMLAHELGHAFFVKRYGYTLVSIKLFPIHGVCYFEYDPEEKIHVLVFAGGLLVQAIIFVVWLGVAWLIDISGSWQLKNSVEPVSRIFLQANFLIFLLNSLPIKGFDGWEIWGYVWWRVKLKIAFIWKLLPERTRPIKYKSSEKVVDLAIRRANKK